MMTAHIADLAHEVCRSMQRDERIEVFLDDLRSIDSQIFHGIGLANGRLIYEAICRQQHLAVSIMSLEGDGVRDAIHECLIERGDLFHQVRVDKDGLFQDIRRHYPIVTEVIGQMSIHGYAAQHAMHQFKSNRHN